MSIRADRVEVRESPDGYRTAVAIGTPAPAGHLPAEARRRRRVHRGRGRAPRVRRPRRRRSASSATRSVRRLRGADVGRRDHRQPDHLRQHDRGVQRHRRRPGRRAGQPGRPRARGADAARRHAGRRRGGARQRAPRPARRCSCDAPSLGDAEVTRAAGRDAAPRRSRLEAQRPAEVLRRAQGRQGRAPGGRQRRGGRPARARTAPARRPAST